MIFPQFQDVEKIPLECLSKLITFRNKFDIICLLINIHPVASRHSPRYRKIATTTTTTITTTTTFPVLLNLGLMDFDINF